MNLDSDMMILKIALAVFFFICFITLIGKSVYYLAAAPLQFFTYLIALILTV